MLKQQVTMLLTADTVMTLDAYCAPYGRSRASVVSEMVQRHAEFLTAVALTKGLEAAKASGLVGSAVATRTLKEPKPEKIKPAGHDGVLVPMQINNPATEPLGSRWLFKRVGALPFLEGYSVPWQEVERVAKTKKNPFGLKWGKDPVPRKEGDSAGAGYPLNPPVFVVKPDDPEDLTGSWQVWKHATVRDEPGTPKNHYWVPHIWNEALTQWVPDAGYVQSVIDRDAVPPVGDKDWSNQIAYGAWDEEQLKALLTVLAGEYNLPDDALDFAGIAP